MEAFIHDHQSGGKVAHFKSDLILLLQSFQEGVSGAGIGVEDILEENELTVRNSSSLESHVLHSKSFDWTYSGSVLFAFTIMTTIGK